MVDLSRVSPMDWRVALILVWAGRVIRLVLTSPQPAVARLLDAVGASRPAGPDDDGWQVDDALSAFPSASLR